jgi:hypothetical protein
MNSLTGSFQAVKHLSIPREANLDTGKGLVSQVKVNISPRQCKGIAHMVDKLLTGQGGAAPSIAGAKSKC